MGPRLVRSTRAQGYASSRQFLPIILLKEYVYCPRYAFYRIFIEKDFTTESMWDAKKFTADHIVNTLKELCDKAKVLTQVSVRSKRLGLQGIADLILVSNGYAKVIEAKLLSELSRRGLRRRYLHVVAQAGAYAMCIEETLNVSVVELGFVDKNYSVLWLPYSPWIRRLVENAAYELHYMYRTEEPPPKYRSTKCHYCCYRNICWESQ